MWHLKALSVKLKWIVHLHPSFVMQASVSFVVDVYLHVRRHKDFLFLTSKTEDLKRLLDLPLMCQ